MNKIQEKQLLPPHYTQIDEPFYKGKGEHGVISLEDLCEKYKEYCHQQRIIKHRLMGDFPNGYDSYLETYFFMAAILNSEASKDKPIKRMEDFLSKNSFFALPELCKKLTTEFELKYPTDIWKEDGLEFPVELDKFLKGRIL